MRKHAKSVNQVMCYSFYGGVQPNILISSILSQDPFISVDYFSVFSKLLMG